MSDAIRLFIFVHCRWKTSHVSLLASSTATNVTFLSKLNRLMVLAKRRILVGAKKRRILAGARRWRILIGREELS